MPESVKISELPALTAVLPNDILPVVDAALTQTSRCTAGQIAAIGGGAPGDGTVTTAKIANGAVTAVKVSFTATDRILGRASAGAGNGEEITCTAFARSLLDDPDAATMRATLGALQGTDSPTFSGTVTINGTATVTGAVQSSAIRTAGGTAAAPSHTFTGDTDTGLFSPAANTVAVATGGIERFSIDGAGLMRAPLPGGQSYRFYGLRAYAAARLSGSTWSIFGGGITSITYGAKGRHHVNFVDQMPDGNYTISLIGHLDTTDSGSDLIWRVGSSTITGQAHLGEGGFMALFSHPTGTLGGWRDPVYWSVMITR